MLRALPTLLLFAAPAAAQFGFDEPSQHASSTYHQRVDGPWVRVALQVSVDDGWHLYHTELGAENAAGIATTLELDGEGIQWSALRMPEPHRDEQVGRDGKDSWAWVHDGDFAVYMLGRLSEGGSAPTTARIDGLTCEDSGSCVPYNEELELAGRGNDALFASFPVDLWAPAGAGAGGAEPSGGPFDEQAYLAGIEGELEGFGAPGSGMAEAVLFARAEDGVIQAAIEIEIEDDWHLYHEELGQEDSVGQPTVLNLGGPGIHWGEVRFPEPYVYDQRGLGRGGADTWIWGHEGFITIYAIGRIAEGFSAEDALLHITGLTCVDDGSCIPYEESLEVDGDGGDSLWEDFPADLEPPVLGPGEGAEAVGSLETGSDSAASDSAANAGAGATEPTDYDPDAIVFSEYAPQTEPIERGLLMWLVLAFVAGAILNVMPCVLPVISIKILSFVQQAGEDKRRVRQLGGAFSLGILVVFMALAAMAVLAGAAWGDQFQSQKFLVVMIGVIFAFSLSLFGLFELGVPSQVGNMAGVSREGLPDAFMKGIFATLLATPCSGPFLGSTLTWTLSQDAFTVFLVFLFLGIGMAFPYVVLTWNPKLLKLLPKPGAWMETFKEAMGFLLLGTAIYLMTILRTDLLLFTCTFLVFVAIGCWWYGRKATFDKTKAVRYAHMAVALAICALGARIAFVDFKGLFEAPEGDDHLAWVEFDPVLLEQYHQDGTSVFVDFTADWCPNCKYNEYAVFESEEIRSLIEDKGVIPMKADITYNTPYTRMIKRLRDQLGAKSIPFLAVFPGDDPQSPHTRIDVVTVDQMTEIFQSLPDPEPQTEQVGRR